MCLIYDQTFYMDFTNLEIICLETNTRPVCLTAYTRVGCLFFKDASMLREKQVLC